MSSMTYREYKLRLRWIDEQQNKPSRSDHYAMQIANEVRRTATGKDTGLTKFKLEWKPMKPQSVDDAKRIWKMALGVRPNGN